MKPMMGQVQSQFHLDDLLGSPKGKIGNIDRPSNSIPGSSKKSASEPSFGDMLLASIDQSKSSPKEAVKPSVQKLPDPTTQIQRPQPKPMPPSIDSKNEEKISRIADDQRSNDSRAVDFDSSQKEETGVASSTVTSRASSAEAKAALAPLKKQLSGKASAEALLNGNAVLAFIAGRLDKLEPESLPSLISQSSLINIAMTSPDVSEFMQSPMTIADLAKLMEIDQSLLNKATNAGLDPSKIVTPKEFINALGLDSGIVTTELSILQQKLPIDGVKPYIERAKAMAAKVAEPLNTGKDPRSSMTSDGLPSDPSYNEKSKLYAKEPLTSPGDISIPVNLATAQPTVPNVKQNSTQSSPPAAMGKPNISSPLPPLSEGVSGQKNRFVDPGETLLAESISGSSNLKNILAKPDLNLDPNSNILLSEKNTINPLNLVDTLQKQIPLDKFSLDQVNDSTETTESDPYAQMGQIMDDASSMRIDFSGDGQTQRSLEELLLDRGSLPKTFEQKLLVTNRSQQSADLSAINPRLMPQSELNPSKLDNSSNRESENFISPYPSLKTDVLAPTLTMNLSDTGSQSFNRDESKDNDSSQNLASQTNELASDTASFMSKGVKDFSDSKVGFSNHLSENFQKVDRGSLASKILDHAQVMFKNGGGAMRVDMETPDMGKVGVAINLNNNQLDIRIMTDSSQARDIISREVSGLRDGLTQQGINLRGIEVGKAGDASSRNFSGQSGQRFGQGQQGQKPSYDEMKNYVQSFKNTYVPRTNDTSSRLNTVVGRSSPSLLSNLGGRRLEVRI